MARRCSIDSVSNGWDVWYRCRRTSNLLDQRHKNETDKCIADTSFHNIWNLLNKEDGNQGHACQREEKRNDNLGQRKLGLRQLLVAILVLVVVCFVDFVEETVMRNRLVIKVDEVSDKRDNGNASRDLQSVVGNHASVRGVVYIVGEVLVENRREDERHYSSQ
jgi:hypothetical protein